MVLTQHDADAREYVSTNLRLPPDLHRQVKNLAERETRSLNGQIVQMLREAVKARPRPAD